MSLVTKVLVAIFVFDLIILNLDIFRRQPAVDVQWQSSPSVQTKAENATPDVRAPDVESAAPYSWITSTYSDPSSSIQQFSRERAHPPGTHQQQPNVLICLMTKDANSWGSNPPAPPRTFASFLHLLHNTTLELSSVSIALLTSSESEFQSYKDLSVHQPFARISIVHHPGYDSAFAANGRGERHNNDVQHSRRAEMAKLRNYLMLTALRDEAHIIWFDADVYEITDGLLPAMIAHTADPKVGVLTARSNVGPNLNGDYDLNAWKGPRSKPNEEERKKMREPNGGVGSWIAGGTEGSKHMGELVHGTNDEELVGLDAVGGTVLLLESRLVRQGLVFAPVYLVGLDWESEGWDAIETEALCVIARGMDAGCYGMGGKWMSHHSTG